MDKTIVVMAAGLGSRYGGVKQIERLGPDGEILMEYAIYDAIRAGFNRIVLIIKPEIYNDVRELFGNRIEESTGIKIDYAFQTLDRFTESRPEFKARTKPFGTVHAVICAADCIKTPFAVMNADDYYGAEAFRVMSEQLEKLHSAQDAAMVAYRLKNTVSPFGTVTRGVCMVDNGLLTGVRETYKIKVMPDGSIQVRGRPHPRARHLCFHESLGLSSGYSARYGAVLCRFPRRAPGRRDEGRVPAADDDGRSDKQRQNKYLGFEHERPLVRPDLQGG